MTREEYVEFANALKNNYTIDFDMIPEFCDMAISALSTEGEYINKSDTIDLIERWGEDVLLFIDDLPTYSFPNSAENKPEYEKLMDDIRENREKEVVIVSAEDNTMEWIRKPHIYGVTYCSKCDYENKVDDTRFCPNCGRKAVSE